MLTINQPITIKSKLFLLGLTAVSLLSVLWALFSPYSVCTHRPLGTAGTTGSCRQYREANAGDRLIPTLLTGGVLGLLVVAGGPTLNVRHRTLTIDPTAQTVRLETQRYLGGPRVEDYAFHHVKALQMGAMSGDPVHNEAPRALYFLDSDGNVLTYSTSSGTVDENAQYHAVRVALRDAGLLSDGMPDLGKLMQFTWSTFRRQIPGQAG